MELEEHDGSGGGVRRVALTVRGLTPAGYLLATDAGGARFELHPDGNRRVPTTQVGSGKSHAAPYAASPSR